MRVDHTLPNYAMLYTGSFSLGQKLFIADYGVTGTYDPSTFTYTMGGIDGVARWDTNSVYWTPFRTSTGSASSRVIGFSAHDANTPHEALFGSGDSGGGTFVQCNGLWQLAGANVYAYSTPASITRVAPGASSGTPTGSRVALRRTRPSRYPAR